MADSTPFTELDFQQVKENLKNYLKGQDRFKDYDFEGSNMNVLLDILSYNTFQNNFYTNMAFSEMFLDSAQQRESAISHAKELNYLPRSRVSAFSKIDLIVLPEDNPSSILLPINTRFSAQCGGTTFSFLTDKNYIIRPTNGIYRLNNIPVYEGRVLREFYTVDGTREQRYIINNESVDISSIRVFVRTNTNQNSERVEYIYSDSVFGITPTDKTFYVEADFNNLYKVTFGKDVFGVEPKNGNVIEIEYRVTKGEDANGARNFSIGGTVSGYRATITRETTASAGAPRESIEDIRYFAPKSLQVQDRAVTRSDYEVLLKQKFPNIQAISVYGGDEIVPPQYGKVIISVDVLGAEGAGDNEIELYRNYIRDKTPLTIEPVFVPAKFLFIDLDITVSYNPRITTKRAGDIETIVRNAIIAYSEGSLNKFGITLRQSRLANVIDTSDISIIGTDVTSRAIIEYVPELGESSNPEFAFRNELIQPYPYDALYGFVNFKPTISSTAFTYQGNLVSLVDDGVGGIMLITADTAEVSVFKRGIGTVDYANGTVRLSNFIVEEFVGNAIEIYAKTSSKDIKASRDRILVIRNQNISVNVVGVR